jgi:hypothetical protein
LRTLGENDTDVPARSPSGEKGDIDDPSHPTNGRGGASPHTDKSDLMSPFWGIIDLQGTGHDHRSPMAPRARSPDRRDTHAWFLDMRDGKVVKAFAFFDSVVFNEFWQRVKP